MLHCTVRDKRVQGGERDVFIPRIQLFPKKLEQYGIEWVRRQFPVSTRHRFLFFNKIFSSSKTKVILRRFDLPSPRL